MKIIIAGAGAVGMHLARMLSKDDQNVTLIDQNIDKLAKLSQELDIMTLGQSPLSIKAQKNAGVDDADLFIAVTPDESVNITCCMIAKQLGAKKTVARVDTYEYVEQENKKLLAPSGVDHLIYPEKIAGQEIAESMQYSWVRQWWNFDGELVLLSVKIHQLDNQLIGKTLRDISQGGHQFHVVAIIRSGDTIIPSGNEVILDQDLVFFMAKRGEIDTIRHLTGKDHYPQVRHAMIIGGTKLAVRADWALSDKLSLKIIEPNEQVCERLSEQTKDRTLIINGAGYDIDLLNDEGYDNLDALIALTDNDEENILACVAARNRGIRKTIAQVENLAYMSMAEQLDIGTIINKKTITASYIYQHMLKADVTNVKILTIADADVAEFIVKENSIISKRPIKDVGIPHNVNIGGLIRNGDGMLVSGNTQLKVGDRVVVFCAGKTLNKLDRYFK